MLRTSARLVLLCVLVLGGASSAHARDDQAGNPLAYDLRTAVFPLAFHAGMTQRAFMLAARAEYALLRRLDVGVFGRLAYANVGGETDRKAYAAGLTLSVHLVESIEHEHLVGTVYPADTPSVSGRSQPGADRDFAAPISTRLGGPAMGEGDYDPTATAVMRSVHSLRLGVSRMRAMEGPRASSLSDDLVLAIDNRIWVAHLGYGFGTQWNLERDVTGKREIGYRRFFLEVLGTMPDLVEYEPLFDTMGTVPKFFGLGARIGMEGAIDALVDAAPGFGFAYSLELGALPGRAGLEGYLFVGLGAAFDVITR